MLQGSNPLLFQKQEDDGYVCKASVIGHRSTVGLPWVFYAQEYLDTQL